MSRLWHGYIAFQKPAAVSAEDWATALAALASGLDETPTASNPAERYHAVTNAATNTTIGEGMFDLSKLNTADLSTMAGVDMTDAWEPLRVWQSHERSHVKAHSLVIDRVWNLGGYDQFVPASAAIAHVQAAIDAAIANGSGEVDCTGLTVTLTDAGSIAATLLSTVHYGLIINGDNVGIKGGTFVLSAEESYTSPYIGILFGNGGGNSGVPGEDGTWCYNNWIRGATINGSALTDEQREAICNNHVSYTVVFDYCQDFCCRGCTVVDGWAGNAQIGCQASSRYGYFLENDIQSGVSSLGSKFAFWCDGAQYVALIANTSTMPNAFQFQSNLDNTNTTYLESGIAKNNIVINNAFTNIGNATGRIVAGLTGSDDTEIIDNVFTSAEGDGFWGIKLWPYGKLNGGLGHSARVIIKGNTFTNSIAQLRPVIFTGYTDNPQTAGVTDPVSIQDAVIQDNVFVGFTRRGYFDNVYCTGAVFSGNTYPAGATTYGYASAGDEATIVANNTLQ